MSEQLPSTTVRTDVARSGVFASEHSFELAQRMAKAFASSGLVPKDYQGNTANALIALELANRIGASPIMVAQNLHVIHGRPSWSSSFIIAAINTCGKFSPLRFKAEGTGDGRTITAFAIDPSGEVLEGPPVSITMAKAEGWYDRAGSKWKTMPELMLRYRSAAFFGRLYAPEILLGMRTQEEEEDTIIDVSPPPAAHKPVNTNSGVSGLNEKISRKRATTAEKPASLEKNLGQGTDSAVGEQPKSVDQDPSQSVENEHF